MATPEQSHQNMDAPRLSIDGNGGKTVEKPTKLIRESVSPEVLEAMLMETRAVLPARQVFSRPKNPPKTRPFPTTP